MEIYLKKVHKIVNQQVNVSLNIKVKYVIINFFFSIKFVSNNIWLDI